MKHSNYVLIRKLLPVIAGSLVAGAAVWGAVTAAFVFSAETTTGTIRAVETTEDEDGDTLYRPTFGYVVADRTYTASSTGFTSPSPGGVGDRVAVLYDPGKPSNARIDSFSQTWAAPTVLLWAGLVFAALDRAGRFIASLHPSGERRANS